MVSQAADALLAAESISGQPDRVRATIRLRCGCEITRDIAADRILDRPDGTRFAVGKYPCPAGHPAG